VVSGFQEGLFSALPIALDIIVRFAILIAYVKGREVCGEEGED